MSDFLSAAEVARETGLSYDAVRRAINAGELRATRLRRRLLVRREWLEEWIEAGVISPAASMMDLPTRSAPRRSIDPAGSSARLLAIERDLDRRM
jgi:excisionase family DNA binding protein